MDLVKCENPECGREFRPNRDWQTFCNSKCRNDYHNGLTKQDRRNGYVKGNGRDLMKDLGLTPPPARVDRRL